MQHGVDNVTAPRFVLSYNVLVAFGRHSLWLQQQLQRAWPVSVHFHYSIHSRVYGFNYIFYITYRETDELFFPKIAFQKEKIEN